MDDLRKRLRTALRASKAAYADVRLERIERTAIELKTRTLETLESAVDEGGIVRVLAPSGGWGTATFTGVEGLKKALERALEAAAVLDATPLSLPALEPVEDERTVVLKEDFRRVPLADKRELLHCLEDAMLGEDARVQDTRVGYRDAFRTVTFASSEGSWIQDERPLVDLYLEAIAASGDELQSARDGLSLVAGLECLADQAELARTVARRAAESLAARPVEGGVYTVVLDPVLAGVLIHEAFGHLCEADHVAANPALAELLRPGRKVGPELLNVSDFGSPEAPGLMGNVRYDDEGVAGGRTELIRAGLLAGLLHSRESAARMGQRPTGNGRAQDFRFAPLVRMTKTVIERGATPLAQLFEGIAHGLYARGSRGGETDLGRYSFTAEEAFLVRDGVVAERVRDVTLTGNVFETLGRVTAVGDDFKLHSHGRCGKQGQSMPVSVGGPHVRIDGVTVGGRAA